MHEQTTCLTSDNSGVTTDETGAVVVDEFFQTAQPDIYAAGDVIGEPILETVAAKEGNHAVKNAFGTEETTIDYTAVPTVVFTSPEVAAVGMTEQEYMAEHGTCACRTVDMADVPRRLSRRRVDSSKLSSIMRQTKSSASI